MGSTVRSFGVVVLAIALAAVPALARPEASKSNGGPRGARATEVPDLHRWRLTRHGFGRLKVGLNRTKIERRTGRSLRFAYNTGSCAIWGIRGVPGLWIMTVEGRLARVDVTKGSWRTSVGIRVGDTKSTVRSRYPHLRVRPHAYDPDGEYLIVPGPNRRVVFEINGDDKVTSFRGGRVPEVMFIEGCA
jgi:hypothetical protein